MLSVAVGACTVATPYQAATDKDGYSDQQIEDNRYLVSFRGNSRTSREVVETYLLYRAAELTVQSGNDWFRIVEQETDDAVGSLGPAVAAPVLFGKKRGRKRHRRIRGRGFRSGGFRRHRFARFGLAGHGFGAFNSRFFFRGYQTRRLERNRFEATANILVFSGEKPEGDPQAYDARQVIENLQPRIVTAE